MPLEPPIPQEEPPRPVDAATLGWSVAETVIESLPLAIFLVDPNHRIILLNQRTAELAHMSRHEILREGCFGIFCDHKTHFEKCPGHASLFSGKPWDGEVDIEGRHYAVVVRPLRIGDRIPYSLVALDDKTDSRRHGNMVRIAFSRLESLLVRASRIRSCLARFTTLQDAREVRDIAIGESADLFGAECAYLVQRLPDGSERIAYYRDRGPADTAVFTDVYAGGSVAAYLRLHGELAYNRGQAQDNNPEFDVFLERAGAHRLLVAPIRDENGGEWGRVGFVCSEPAENFRDDVDLLHEAVSLIEIAIRRAGLIEQIERNRQDLVEAAEEARQAARTQTMFLATMSHEIRTPLNAIIGFAEILGRSSSGLSPEARECSDGITRSANALLDLLNDILDLSKIKSGADDLLQGECDLPALFREMATVFRYSALAKGIELRPDIPPDFPLLRLAGPRIRQILLNLIGNAVKFTGRGAVEWTASCTPDGPDAVLLSIDVRDTGPGIPPNRLNDIFNPFVQASSLRPDSPTQKGSGLGLLIVKRLVEACRGSITVESELGKGSVFHVRIGRVATIPRPAATAPETPQPARSAAAIGPDFLPLLVDDIALNLHILALHLRSLGIPETLQASSGDEALAKIRERRPSIVFTDLWMPGMDGAQLARAIRSDHDLRGIPVVAVTADNDAAASFDASVFDDILVKPLVSEKIAACLARLFPPA